MKSSIPRALLLLFLPLLGLSVGLVLNAKSTPLYASSARLSFLVVTQGTPGGAPNNFAESRALSYKEVATTPAVYQDVAHAAGNVTPAAVGGAVRVSVPASTADMRIEAVSGDPGEAEAIVKGYVQVMKDRVAKSEKESVGLGASTVGLIVMADPSPAERVEKSALISPAVGLLLGAALSLGVSLLWRRPAVLTQIAERRLGRSA